MKTTHTHTNNTSQQRQRKHHVLYSIIFLLGLFFFIEVLRYLLVSHIMEFIYMLFGTRFFF